MNRESIRDYVEQSDAVLDSSPQMDEANTKAAVLRDFLDLLDWQIPQNTQLEYSVEAFGQTYKVDYSLVLDGTPVAFLEAKGVDTSLTQDHEEQLSSYMTNKNVTYGILTNGKQYRFFQRRVDASNVDVQKVDDVALKGLPDNLTLLNAYTKDAIETGKSEDFFERINELREARKTLEAEKDDLAVQLSNTLADEVSDSISSLAETQAKELIDRLVADIDSEVDDDGGGTDEPVGGGGDGFEPTGNHIAGAIRRSEIDGNDDAKVAVFPTKESGLPFLKENNAWGFVRIGDKPDYVAMYVSRDVQEVRYFATAKEIVSPEDAELKREPESYVDRDEIEEGKKVVVFEPGSLYELEDPIPFKNKWPQSLQYTTLGKLRTAETTDDLFADDSKRRKEPNSIEELVLEAVRENSGTSLRTIHRTVAEFDESPIEWVDEWGESRTDVQTALQNLRDMNLVRLDNRSWFPVDSDVAGEYIFEIQDGDRTLVTLDGDNQSDVMADAVDYLIQNHDLISCIDPLPYVPGNKNALINDQPTHPDEERKMRTHRELMGDYYLFTSFNKRDKKRHVQRLADKCGLDIESRGGW